MNSLFIQLPFWTTQINYADLQHGATSGGKVTIGSDPVVQYAQLS